MKKDLLTLRDITPQDLNEIFELTAKLKQQRDSWNFKPLAGKSIGLIFAKASTRTRVSFEVGVHELGGNPLYLDQSKMQVGRGETVADTAQVLSRYLHGVVIRTFSHSDVEELAAKSTFHVVNALTDEYHPCQILADLFTILEYSKSLKVKLAFVGDGASNIANSLILASKLTGMEVAIGAPLEFKPSDEILAEAPNAHYYSDPAEAVKNADYVYTDVWVSMGFEEEKARRLALLQSYQVSWDLLKNAKKEVKILHCLPAHRGEEIAADVMDSPASIVFDEAENRLHVQKAVLALLFGAQWR